ncbi:hypothetical protein [Yoonia sp. SS1-5]|uniref:Uncharacterized protein n=1 Tax=Yoonia rhodophyticola TaxID=3137370 RepID=A0AAN0MEJ7_9RHOB
MKSTMKAVATASTMALVLTFSAATITTFTTTAAYAERGNGNGNGNGNRNGNRGNGGNDRADKANRAGGNGNGNGRGALARELRSLNAAHANQNALQNASPNSMPGKLYTYQQTRQEFIEVVREQDAAYEEYNRLIGLSEEEVAAEYPDGGYEDAVTAAAEEYDVARDAALDAQSDTEASLLVLTEGRALSAEAAAELHRLLGF